MSLKTYIGGFSGVCHELWGCSTITAPSTALRRTMYWIDDAACDLNRSGAWDQDWRTLEQGCNFISLWEGPSHFYCAEGNEAWFLGTWISGLSHVARMFLLRWAVSSDSHAGLSPTQWWADPPMLVRKGFKFEEKSDSIRILMVPTLNTFPPLPPPPPIDLEKLHIWAWAIQSDLLVSSQPR